MECSRFGKDLIDGNDPVAAVLVDAGGSAEHGLGVFDGRTPEGAKTWRISGCSLAEAAGWAVIR